MKCFFIVLLGAFSITCGFAQKSYTLVGSLGVETGETFTYKLEFVDSAGSLSGYSYTYLKAGAEVKTSIKGKIDRVNQSISIQETDIVENKGFYSNATICLIKTKLKYMMENGKMVLNGPVKTSDAANMKCDGGSISLKGDGDAQALFAAAPDTSMNMPVVKKPGAKVVVVYDTASKVQGAKPAPTAGVKQITQGKDEFIEWNTDTIILDIWDGGKIDNDIVNIMYNGRPVLKNFSLVAGKKQLRLPLSGEVMDIITIVAVNEGGESPNTANITLFDGEKQYPIVAYNDISKEAVIRIKKKK